MCSRHNRFRAEKDYGADTIARAVAASSAARQGSLAI